MMEKAKWHLPRFAISYIISSSARSVGNIFTACVPVFQALSRNLVMLSFGCGTHNKVNERLMKEEASLETADPEFPKIIWPPGQLCASCYRGKSGADDWDHDEVFKFLMDYYGKTLVTLYKEKEEVLAEKRAAGGVLSEDLTASSSVHAVVVPVGAALAIAAASCAFGALACYWSQQQKSRRPRRSWN